MNEVVRVDVFSGQRYDGDWPPDGFTDALAWFQDKLAQIPDKFKGVARCEISSEGGYEDSHYGYIEIWYYRPETEDEKAERIAKRDAELAAQRFNELAILRTLKEKYPEAT